MILKCLLFGLGLSATFKRVILKDSKSCIEYEKVLPSGACGEYLRGKKIAQPVNKAIKLNKHLATFYTRYLPMYEKYEGREENVRSLFELYATLKCGWNRKIKKIIKQIELPTVSNLKKCANETMEFVCRAAHPICHTNQEKKVVVAKPCRKKCKEAWKKKSCSFVRPLFKSLKKLLRGCPRYKKYLTKSKMQVTQCNALTNAYIIDTQYCRPKAIELN